MGMTLRFLLSLFPPAPTSLPIGRLQLPLSARQLLRRRQRSQGELAPLDAGGQNNAVTCVFSLARGGKRRFSVQTGCGVQPRRRE